MATPADIVTLTRCCDAPYTVEVAHDNCSSWHEIRCAACHAQPARTHNVPREKGSQR